MNDPLKARLDKLRKFSDSAHRRANLYSDVAKMDSSHTAGSLGAFTKGYLLLVRNSKKLDFDVMGS